jgi:hypothetical protein
MNLNKIVMKNYNDLCTSATCPSMPTRVRGLMPWAPAAKNFKQRIQYPEKIYSLNC